MVALKQKQTRMNFQKISKTKSFINKFNWKGINYPSQKGDWKSFEKKNKKTVLNVLSFKIMNIYLVYN